MEIREFDISRIGCIFTILSLAIGAACGAETPQRALASKAAADRVIAIDVLLVPDSVMAERAKGANAQLRSNYPQGYTLGQEQAPHITLVHRYVREKDLDAIDSAVAKVLDKAQPLSWQLEANGFGYTIWAGLATTVINVERTPELARLDAEVIKAVEPFAVAEETAAAFSTTRELPKIDDKIVTYVAKFVPNSSGENYKPHVTVGVAHEDFVKDLKDKPFARFTFKPAGVAIYQLGNFGTAQKKLWEWNADKPASESK